MPALDSKAPLASPALTGVPTAPTAVAGTNTTQIASTAFVKTAVDNLIDSAPGALDTLNELAAALGDDANFGATMTTALAGKQATIGDGDLTIARTTGLQTALDSKQAILSAGNKLNAEFIGGGNVTSTEFDYLDGVTSNIQTQLDARASTGKAIAMAMVFG